MLKARNGSMQLLPALLMLFIFFLFSDNECRREVRTTSRKRKVSNHIDVPEVDQLLSHAADPDISFMSVSGAVSCGKTYILDSFCRRYIEVEGLTLAKVIKIDGNVKLSESVDWLFERILRALGHRIPERSIEAEAKDRLLEYVNNHDMVILVLDISVIPKHPVYGQLLLNFLHDIIQSENNTNNTTGRLKLVVSALCSLIKTKLFHDLDAQAVEIVVDEIPMDSAVDFILSINSNLPRKYAELLCEHYERSPLVLKCIASSDVAKELEVPPDDEIEFKKAFEINEDQLTKCLCADDENKQHIVTILNSIGYENRRLITQCRVFPFEFDRERANLIVDPDINVTLTSLQKFGCNGFMLLKSRRCEETGRFLFRFPKVVGELLKTVIFEDSCLRSTYNIAEQRFCELYFKLLSFLSNSFSGNDPERSDELTVLGPLTPHDGVPDSHALTQQSNETKAKLTIGLFRRHQSEIIRALKVSVRHEKLHFITLNLVTQMPILTLLNKMLLLHQQLAIYRKIKRIQHKNNVFEAKLNVCVAYFLMYAFGFQRYCAEARSLLEGALTILEKHKGKTDDVDSYANCLSKLGRCLASEKGIEEKEVMVGIGHITAGASLWSLKEDKKVSDEVLVAACRRHQGGRAGEGLLFKNTKLLENFWGECIVFARSS